MGTALGSIPRPCGWPGSTPPPLIPPTGGSNGTLTVSRTARCRKAPRTWYPGCCLTPATRTGTRPWPPPRTYLLSLGITGWQDAIIGSFDGARDNLPVYLRAAGAGRLAVNVTGPLWWDRERAWNSSP